MLTSPFRVNTADPYSVEVGEFYIKARGLTRAQVLRVQLPLRPALTPDEFKTLAAAVDAFFDAPVQALALAWTQPFAVACNSITGALALGFDGALCDHRPPWNCANSVTLSASSNSAPWAGRRWIWAWCSRP